MHYYLIAGEASGDLHAAALIEAIRRRDEKANFTFLGGDKMAEAAGCQPIIHYREMAYMGVTEVVRHWSSVMHNLKTAKSILHQQRPDCLILIDYPSFNLKVAKVAAKLGIPVYYYISPKLWAWKKWRIKSMRKLVRLTLCILPFEPDFFRKNRYDRAAYVGNPSVEEIDAALASVEPRDEFLSRNRLRDRRIIAMLPGSRKGEIISNIKIMNEVARRFPQYTIVVAGAPGIDDDFYADLTKYTVVRDATHTLLAHAHAALVTSGTATLEAALIGTPQVVMYRSNGWPIVYHLMKIIMHIKHVSLPNLIVNKQIIPEQLLHFCNAPLVGDELAKLTPDNSPHRQAQLDGYAEMRQELGTNPAAETAAKEILNDLPYATQQH